MRFITKVAIVVLSAPIWLSSAPAAAAALPADPGTQVEATSASSEAAPYGLTALNLELLGATDGPSGNWAIGLTTDLGRWLTLALSAGEDVSGQHLRVAFAPRVRVLTQGPWALDVAPVISVADGEELGEQLDTPAGTQWLFERRWGKAYRGSVEAGVTYRTRSRLAFRAFAGVGVPLNQSTCMYWTAGGQGTTYGCDSPSIPEELRDRYKVFPYLGLSTTLGVLPFGAEPDGWKMRSLSRDGYGLQILAADTAAAVAGVATATRDTALYFWIGDTTAAAALHAAHARPGRALASAALRTSLTFVGALVGMQIAAAPREYDQDPFAGASQGALAGAAAAALIDSILIARLTPAKD